MALFISKQTATFVCLKSNSVFLVNGDLEIKLSVVYRHNQFQLFFCEDNYPHYELLIPINKADKIDTILRIVMLVLGVRQINSSINPLLCISIDSYNELISNGRFSLKKYLDPKDNTKATNYHIVIKEGRFYFERITQKKSRLFKEICIVPITSEAMRIYETIRS